ncbi:MAG: lytic transglycosylase [Bradyrhizobium sp.]|nr:lytic transglycosylase [Bradyrhizobium sp.]
MTRAGTFRRVRGYCRRRIVRCAGSAAAALALMVLSDGVAAHPIASAPGATPAPAAPIADHVAAAARRFGVPESWIWAVMRVESGGNPRAVSPAGAIGLMQLMPATWARLRSRYELGDDVFDAHDNIMAGTAFLREMFDRYGTPGFLAAYNAGPGRYDDYVSRGRPLPAVTVAYVAMLAPIVGNAERAPRVAIPAPDPLAWTRATLFSQRPHDGSTDHQDVAVPATDTPPGRARPDLQPAEAPASRPPADGLFIPVSVRSPR